MMAEEKQPHQLIGVILYGALITGIASLLAAVVAFFSGDLSGAGMCLVAAALAFGLTLNALLRH
jgi:uncharacterized membrane-anchored protein